MFIVVTAGSRDAHECCERRGLWQVSRVIISTPESVQVPHVTISSPASGQEVRGGVQSRSFLPT